MEVSSFQRLLWYALRTDLNGVESRHLSYLLYMYMNTTLEHMFDYNKSLPSGHCNSSSSLDCFTTSGFFFKFLES